MVFVQLQLNRQKEGEACLLPEGGEMFFLVLLYTLQQRIGDGFVKKQWLRELRADSQSRLQHHLC